MSTRHGQSNLIHQVRLTKATRQQILRVLLDAYSGGYLVIEYHTDGETWIATGDGTLVITLPADSFKETL
jgi:hypothetical protein